jgi:hypothetical protein
MILINDFMKQFVQTKLFSLIEKSTMENVPVSEWEKSYEEFANAIFAVKTSSSNRMKFHNSLCYAQAELAYLQGRKNLKKKCNGIAIYGTGYSSA